MSIPAVAVSLAVTYIAVSLAVSSATKRLDKQYAKKHGHAPNDEKRENSQGIP